MKQGTRWKIELFAENARVVKKDIWSRNAMMLNRLVALIYTVKGKQVDNDSLRRSSDILKSSSGIFTAFRGALSIYVAAMSSFKGDPKTQLDQTEAVYEMMRDAGFRRTAFLIMVANTVAVSTEPGNYQATVARMKSFYDGMKEQHKFYVGADDYMYAAMLALSDADPVQGVEKVGLLFRELEPELSDKNGILMLAQIMVAAGMTDPAGAKRVLAIRDALEANKIHHGRSYGLPLLGVLAMIPGDPGSIAQDIAEAKALLRAQKGFGKYSATEQEVILDVVAITASGYADDVEGGTVAAVASAVTINMIIAAQMAAAAAAAVAGAAAAGAAAAAR